MPFNIAKKKQIYGESADLITIRYKNMKKAVWFDFYKFTEKGRELQVKSQLISNDMFLKKSLKREDTASDGKG